MSIKQNKPWKKTAEYLTCSECPATVTLLAITFFKDFWIFYNKPMFLYYQKNIILKSYNTTKDKYYTYFLYFIFVYYFVHLAILDLDKELDENVQLAIYFVMGHNDLDSRQRICIQCKL